MVLRHQKHSIEVISLDPSLVAGSIRVAQHNQFTAVEPLPRYTLRPMAVIDRQLTRNPFGQLVPS